MSHRTYRAVRSEPDQAVGNVIVFEVTEHPGFLARLFGARTYVRTERYLAARFEETGPERILWYSQPAMRRAPPWLEALLLGEWKRFIYVRDTFGKAV